MCFDFSVRRCFREKLCSYITIFPILPKTSSVATPPHDGVVCFQSVDMFLDGTGGYSNSLGKIISRNCRIISKKLQYGVNFFSDHLSDRPILYPF